MNIRCTVIVWFTITLLFESSEASGEQKTCVMDNLSLHKCRYYSGVSIFIKKGAGQGVGSDQGLLEVTTLLDLYLSIVTN